MSVGVTDLPYAMINLIIAAKLEAYAHRSEGVSGTARELAQRADLRLKFPGAEGKPK